MFGCSARSSSARTISAHAASASGYLSAASALRRLSWRMPSPKSASGGAVAARNPARMASTSDELSEGTADDMPCGSAALYRCAIQRSVLLAAHSDNRAGDVLLAEPCVRRWWMRVRPCATSDTVAHTAPHYRTGHARGGASEPCYDCLNQCVTLPLSPTPPPTHPPPHTAPQHPAPRGASMLMSCRACARACCALLPARLHHAA
jgi:hypothetical protein